MQNSIWDALYRRRGDLGSIMGGDEASRAVKELLDDAACSADEMRDYWSSPEENLGPFRDLPPEMKEGLAESALFSFVEGSFLTSPMVTGAVHGRRARFGYWLIRTGWILLEDWHFKGGRFLVRLGRKIATSAKVRGKSLLARNRFSDQYRMPLAYALWMHCGCDVLGLIQDYIEDIPIDRRVCPVWKSPEHHSESSMLIGIDTIMHRGKVYFVESNLNPGFHADRLSLFPEGDPVCRNILEYAAEKGYSRVAFCPANVASTTISTSYLMELELEEGWRKIASEKGLELDVIDSPVLGSPYKRKSELFMSDDDRDTLHVNVRDLPSPLSRLLGTKGKLEDLLAVRNREHPEEDHVLFPREINSDRELPSPEIDPRFPNIIVKDKRLDQGRGIVMYKCKKLPEGVNQGTRQAFEFVVPDRETIEVDGSPEEFVYVFRTHVLLTVDGPRYLAIRKDISSEPVPAGLEEGRVVNTKAFISNLHLGSYSVQTTDFESAAHERFCLAVGAVLCDKLFQKHGTPTQ